MARLMAQVVRETGNGVNHDLTFGEKYAVEDIEMGGFYTGVFLEGMDFPYNSVIFKFFEGEEELDIYEDPRFNPYL